MTAVVKEMKTPEFAGKRAVVTGGTRGIGAAVVRRLLEAGAQVVTSARSAAGEPPEGAAFVRADMRTVAGAEAVAAAARDAMGGVDIVVHNAGGAQAYEGSMDIPDEVWQDALDLNFLSSVRLNALLAPQMRERRQGAIVHISSAATLAPEAASFLHYAAAKAALETYSRGLALELAPYGVRVNAVSPGRIATPGGEQTRAHWAEVAARMKDAPAQNDTALATTPVGRDGLPDDIANAVLFLVSERASFLIGRTLVVDGGEFPMG